ncbi:MAG: ribosome biogenesis factor YjgA [Pseudomonadota bacterium]
MTEPEDSTEATSQSKSARKREMTSLQELGERLISLSDGERDQLPIDSEPLLDAIQQARQIKSHSALRRQRQYIGKLMRNIDAAPIQQALDALHQTKIEEGTRFKQLESLRDEIVNNGNQGIELVIRAYPAAERQHLRQFSRDISREAKSGRPPAASRRLFRYLRELADAQT